MIISTVCPVGLRRKHCFREVMARALARPGLRKETAVALGSRPSVMAPSFFLLVAGAIAIGFAPIFVRLAATGPIATAFWRMALAVPILWIISRHRNTLDKAMLRSPWIWVAGLAFALDLAAWHFAIRLTSVTNATLLANCAVLLVPPLSWLFLRRAIRLSTIAYGALAFVGNSFTEQSFAAHGRTATPG